MVCCEGDTGAVARLLGGFRAFHDSDYPSQRDTYRRLAEQGQSPRTMMVSCVDSRVDPVTLTQAGPGELFVLRNVANLVPPFAAANGVNGVGAALEFAVKALKVENIIVLGHSACGGIAQAMKEQHDAGENDFINSWVETVRPQVQRTLRGCEDKSESGRSLACELAGIGVSLNNLMTFPWIAEKVREKQIFLHGWHFDIGSCRLRVRRPEDGIFVDSESGAESAGG